MPWKKIIGLPDCRTVALKNFPQFFTLKNADGTHWLIGQYEELTGFASALRHDETLRDFLTVHRIRIGLRDSDVAPTGIERQKNYGTSVRGEKYNEDFKNQRLNPVAGPVRALKVPPLNRITDQEENIKHFWESQTPQSHHIVEFNNLQMLGVSCRDGCEGMDYSRLPAVLLAAEFHQRYISSILKPMHSWERERLEIEMPDFYAQLYLERSKLFEPLWSVSKVIFERAGVKV